MAYYLLYMCNTRTESNTGVSRNIDNFFLSEISASKIIQISMYFGTGGVSCAMDCRECIRSMMNITGAFRISFFFDPRYCSQCFLSAEAGYYSCCSKPSLFMWVVLLEICFSIFFSFKYFVRKGCNRQPLVLLVEHDNDWLLRTDWARSLQWACAVHWNIGSSTQFAERNTKLHRTFDP